MEKAIKKFCDYLKIIKRTTKKDIMALQVLCNKMKRTW